MTAILHSQRSAPVRRAALQRYLARPRIGRGPTGAACAPDRGDPPPGLRFFHAIRPARGRDPPIARIFRILKFPFRFV